MRKRFLATGSMWDDMSNLPAHVVWFTDPQLGQAVGLFLVLIGAGRHNGLPAALCAGRVGAGTEQQLMGVVRGHTVKELPQSLVALRSVTGPRAGWRLDACRDVFRTELLTCLIYVARLGSIQAAVDRRHFRLYKESKTQMRGRNHFILLCGLRTSNPRQCLPLQGLIGAGIDLLLSPPDFDVVLHLQMKRERMSVCVEVQTKPKWWLCVIGLHVMNRTWMVFKCCMSPGAGCVSAEA